MIKQIYFTETFLSSLTLKKVADERLNRALDCELKNFLVDKKSFYEDTEENRDLLKKELEKSFERFSSVMEDLLIENEKLSGTKTRTTHRIYNEDYNSNKDGKSVYFEPPQENATPVETDQTGIKENEINKNKADETTDETFETENNSTLNFFRYIGNEVENFFARFVDIYY